MNNINLFWVKIKSTIKLKSLVIASATFFLISFLFSILLLVNSSRSQAQDLSTNWYVFLSIKNGGQIISLGFVTLIVAIKLFHKDSESGILNLELRAGKKAIVVFATNLQASLLIIWSLIGITFIFDLILSCLNPYNFLIMRSVSSYLYFLLFAFILIGATIVFSFIFKITYAFVILILVIFGLSFATAAYSLFSSEEKIENNYVQANAEWEFFNAWEYYRILKSNDLYEEMKDTNISFYQQGISNDRYLSYFSLSEAPEQEFSFTKIIKIYANPEFKITNSDYKALPSMEIGQFNYFEFKNDFKFNKVLPDLIEKISKSDDEEAMKYLPIFKYFNQNQKYYQTSFYLPSQENLNLLERNRWLRDEVFEYYDYNYGVMYSSWLLMNFNKAVFSISDNLIKYLYNYQSYNNNSDLTNFLFNPWTRMSQMMILKSDNIYLSNIFQILDYSLFGTTINGRIKIDYQSDHEKTLNEIIKNEDKIRRKNGFQPDLISISNSKVTSYYDLVNKASFVAIMPVWLIYISEIFNGSVVLGIGYFLYNKKYLK
ncbi:hypothetical protein [Spiroplasma alleghenense]|uniref:Uncharacterized protein n=1 Tax=Spiroplasma alleghenense TaxID=216931 RepID=A0A345Z3N7_9MOLU|nr:hypothetical protein [Spiroplasma alleghenense]AXK51216.1 hypothetical protein SALLE_v1c05420 [Spiroplasma alleghenense]